MRKPFCRHPRCRIQPGQPDRFLAQRATGGVDRLPPCNATCPAGENIQQWLFHAEEGHYEAAWRVLTRDNPLAAIMGRVCYHPARAPATAASSTNRSASMRWSASSATRPHDRVAL